MSSKKLSQPEKTNNYKDNAKKRQFKISLDTFKEDSNANKENEKSFIQWLQDKMNTIFIDNIPLESIKDLDTKYMYLFGALAYGLTGFLFFWFFIQGLYQATHKKYVSLNNDDICEVVQRSITDQWYISHDGEYEGSKRFEYSLAVYKLQLFDFRGDLKGYQHMLNDINFQLHIIGNLAKNQTLSENIVIWSSWLRNYSIGENKNLFQMSGIPASIFNNRYLVAYYASVTGDCRLNSTKSYDSTLGRMTISLDHSKFISDPICNEINPVKLGYIHNLDLNDFSTDLDVSGVMTCIAVNSGVLSLEHLDTVYLKGFNSNIVIPGIGKLTVI